MHRRPKALGVTRGELDLLALGELENGGEAKGAVEVDVKVRLGEALDELEGDGAD
jgi:hypothetical protein